MYCTHCGTRNPDGGSVCVSCGAALPSFDRTAPPQTIKVATYLVPAILTTLCCCVPFGIVAIVYAARAHALAGVGDLAGASAASKKAKLWTWLAFGLGLLIILFYCLFAIILGRFGGEP